MIVVNNLSKDFGTRKAVDNLTFTVDKGEVFGLLGANGAGKTTTLRMLATMLAPTGGSAEIEGFSITKHQHEIRQRIGLLFGGDTGLYDRLTAAENIEYFAELNDVPIEQAKKRIKEFGEVFNFAEYLNTPAGKLSKGTRQKVSFARAIIHNPIAMLFDEPTLGLDVTSKKEVEDFILRCRDAGNMIILSDHNLTLVEKLCSRIGIIKDGKLQCIGKLDELLKQHNKATLEELFFEMVGIKL